MKDEYYDIDFRQKHPTVKGYWVQADKFTEMYRKATALDKIRAEIERLSPNYPYTDDFIDEYVIMRSVLQIIDKYKDGLYEALDIIDRYKAKNEG